MSARSQTLSVGGGGSVRGSVKLAGEEAKDRMYEPKHKKKVVRVLTVIAYVFSVSLAAIMLSMYYIFIWQGTKPSQHQSHSSYSQTSDCCRNCLGTASGGLEQQVNMMSHPGYNDSQVAETPRVLPAKEEISTTPLSRLAQEYLDLQQQKNNHSVPALRLS